MMMMSEKEGPDPLDPSVSVLITGFHPETDLLIQQKHLTPQNKKLVPHCGKRCGTPPVNDQLSGVTEGSSQMNTWPAALMSPGQFGGVGIG